MISPVCCDYSEPMEKASPPSVVLGKRAREDVSEQTPPGSSSKLFQCGDCRKSYSRVDHLARHVRLHTKVSVFCFRVTLAAIEFDASLLVGKTISLSNVQQELCKSVCGLASYYIVGMVC
jgi:hypothetical protein